MSAPSTDLSPEPQRHAEPRSARWLPGSSNPLTDVLACVIILASLWALHIFGRTLSDAALLAIWILLTAILTCGLFVRARIRRRAFLYAYLHPASALAIRWRGGLLMAVRTAALSAALAAVLMIALLRVQDSGVWITLIAAALLLAPLQHYLQRRLASQANAAWLPELAWRLSIAALGVVMIAALVLLALYRPQPELAGVGLDTAVWHFVERETARSETAALLLEFAAAKDGLKLWLGQQLLPEPGISFLQAAAWAVILAEELLFVWSYLLVISATLITRSLVITRIGKGKPGHATDAAHEHPSADKQRE
jgi:hypothetical protein